jgi:hypothetical protein
MLRGRNESKAKSQQWNRTRSVPYIELDARERQMIRSYIGADWDDLDRHVAERRLSTYFGMSHFDPYGDASIEIGCKDKEMLLDELESDRDEVLEILARTEVGDERFWLNRLSEIDAQLAAAAA